MAIDPKLIEELETRRKKAILGGGQDKIEKRHSKGLMTARERINAFFDEGSFREFGMHVEHNCTNFGMEKKELPGDGVVSGVGLVNGRQVAAFSQDFTVGGGSLGKMHAEKICYLMDYAMTNGLPLVGVNDSGGARIQEAVNALSGYGQVFFKNVAASGVVPQIAVIAGPCAGGAAYSPALMDFNIMTRSQAQMFICGPQVIKAATGEEASVDQFGSAAAHATISGNIHFVAEDDRHAMELTQKLLSFLPANNKENPPHQLTPEVLVQEEPAFDELVPQTNRMPLDMYKMINLMVDQGEFLEVHKDWAKSMIVGFARIDGMVVGIVANQPMYKAGTMDIDSSDKAARFIRFCNAFNIPLVNLVDVPGYMPGLAQEQGGIIRHGAKVLYAYSEATVPKVTLILRKAYGGAYIAMCCKDLGADAVYAWPTAEIAVMGAEGAVNVLYARDIKAAEDPNAVRAEKMAEYSEQFANPYQAAKYGMINDVIKPSESRYTISLALRSCMNKKVSSPSRKHGLMPV